MTIQCGDRALEDYRKKQESVTAVSVALSAPPEKVGDAVLHMKEQMDQIRMKLNQMQAFTSRDQDHILAFPCDTGVEFIFC